MANELLPCPFCGGPAEIYNPFHMIGKPSQPATYRGGVRCRACGCESKATTPPDGAITTWNRRADAAPQASTVAGEAQPFMYGIMGPDGKAHFEEFCVSGDRDELQAEVVDHLNRDNPEDGTYTVVALFRDAAPQASAEDVRLFGIDLGVDGIALVRNAALEEAYEAVACLYAAYYQHSKRSESDDILQALKQAGDDIRALKQPQGKPPAPSQATDKEQA